MSENAKISAHFLITYFIYFLVNFDVVSLDLKLEPNRRKPAIANPNVLESENVRKV